MSIPHRLYVGTIGEGLWRSTDSGATFDRAYDGLFVECHVRAIAVHPYDPRVLYLGTEQGLFRSSDGAGHWSRVEGPLNGLQIWSVLLLPDNPELLLVGTCPSRLFRSEDGGQTWTEPSVRILQDCPRIMHTRVTTLVADPVDAQTVWAGVEIDGLYRSKDAGCTWQPVGKRLSSRDIHALAIVPGKLQSTRWFASTNNDVNLSTDGGDTWQPMNLPKALPLPYFRGLAQKCGQPRVLFLGHGDAPPGTTGVIVRSTDGGMSWQPMPMPGRANSTVWGYAVHPAEPELVYGYSVSGEVYRSTDGGSSWEKLSRVFGEIRSLAWTP
jgi:photosystem II stability/assembly factor-like uncharacterized protein